MRLACLMSSSLTIHSYNSTMILGGRCSHARLFNKNRSYTPPQCICNGHLMYDIYTLKPWRDYLGDAYCLPSGSSLVRQKPRSGSILMVFGQAKIYISTSDRIMGLSLPLRK